MASPSPPASPPADDWDPDVNDAAVFADPAPPVRNAGEGISLSDLADAQQAYGDPLVEGEEEAWTGARDPGPLAAEMAAQEPERRLPSPSRSSRPTAAAPGILPAPIDIDDEGILANLLHNAAAPPPFAFPTGVSFDITFPPLGNYTASFNGYKATDRRYWAYTVVHCDGRQDYMRKLDIVCDAGLSFGGRRLGIGGYHSPEAQLRDLLDLVRAVFALQEFDTITRLSKPNQRHIAIWIANKLNFVVDHMAAVVEGEKAYYGAVPITNPLLNNSELQRLRDRFNAVIERTLHWPNYIAQGSKLKGQLIHSSLDNGQKHKMKLALTQPLQPDGTPRWPGFRRGHTKYDIMVLQAEDVHRDEAFLAALPQIKIARAPTAVEMQILQEPRIVGAVPNIDISASTTATKLLNTLARGVVQQHVALSALLATCSHPTPDSPWKNYENIVQLGKSNTNRRSIMVFKSAWLVVAMAEKLWQALRKHERKGQLDRNWVANEKPRVKRVLEAITRDGVFTQVDAAREALRHAKIVGDKKYWRAR